jgi:glycine dehydrogenase subunit 2
MKSEGRPTAPVAANSNDVKTVSGSKALEQATQLIFETGSLQNTGVDLPQPIGRASRLGGHARQGDIGLPGLSEPETLRHYVRLSQKNYAIDLGVYPLGSWS